MIEKNAISELCQKAVEMRSKSYAPYSDFLVGSAVLTEDGEIFTGCNIENSAFGPSICAERTAIAKAVRAKAIRAFGVRSIRNVWAAMARGVAPYAMEPVELYRINKINVL